MKTFVLVGGGPSNVIAAIMIKKKDPNATVILLDRNKEPLKKLKMTGNGKCNIAPVKDDIEKYHNGHFLDHVFEEITLDQFLMTLDDLGVKTKVIGDGYYPLSENAPNVAKILMNQLETLGVIVREENVLSYEVKDKIYIRSNKNRYEADYLFIATGGCSYYQTGSDGSFFNILKEHHYHILTPRPSLCPITVNEKTTMLFGARAKATISLYSKDKLVKEEKGELMFKKDGLSGIAIMNLSKYIAHNYHKDYKFVIKLIDVSENEFIRGNNDPLTFLLSYVSEPIAKYLLKQLNIKEEGKLTLGNKKSLYSLMNNLTFTYKALYGMEAAQVSTGGVSIEDLYNDFSSKLEKNVYILGETVDIDGECGGYNLRYCISSALYAVKRML